MLLTLPKVIAVLVTGGIVIVVVSMVRPIVDVQVVDPLTVPDEDVGCATSSEVVYSRNEIVVGVGRMKGGRIKSSGAVAIAT